jgi:hypothetical protein
MVVLYIMVGRKGRGEEEKIRDEEHGHQARRNRVTGENIVVLTPSATAKNYFHRE